MAMLSGGGKLAEINKQDSQMGALLQRIITAVNRVATNTNTSAVGNSVQAPQPPTGMTVSQTGEMLHYSISHPGTVTRGVRYFSEIAKDPGFAQIVTIRDHGTSRTPAPITLPTNDSKGSPHAYYLRSYAQYQSSPPSEVYTYGGTENPTPITMTGTSKLDFAPSTGSGTASNSGGQSGYGLGRFPTRA